MALVINATPGDASANSYLTLAEANAYFESRALVAAWDALGDDEKGALLVMATRLVDAMYSPQRIRVTPETGDPYYLVTPYWTGTATVPETQALCWPRVGMLNRHGAAIGDTVVPQALKDATAEMAAQLAITDRTLDNDAAVQGVTSVKAGSVSVAFRSGGVLVTKVLPDVVTYLLVPSWLTEEVIEGPRDFDFEVI